MNIMWHSSAPFGPSSYSVLTKRTVPELVRQGHQIVVHTWYGLQGEPQKWPIHLDGKDSKTVGEVTILPSMTTQTYGTETMLATYRKMKADCCITCVDVWVIPPNVTSHMVFAPWLPVDHEPCPQPILNSLGPSAYTMIMSEWGTEVVKAAGLEAHYVPCSADGDLFKPGDKRLAREKLGIDPNCFLVTMVAANKDQSDRKGFSEAIQAFGKFVQMRDDAKMYIHTLWDGAIKVETLLRRCNVPQQSAFLPDQLDLIMGVYKDDYMVNVYNASDVLLNPSKSEGFGLPILEAQLCGCPVICTDFSTTDELTGWGWKVGGQPCWSFGADSWRITADVDQIVDALEEAYHERNNKKGKNKARGHAMTYHTPLVAERYWKPALADIQGIIDGVGGGKLQLVEF